MEIGGELVNAVAELQVLNYILENKTLEPLQKRGIDATYFIVHPSIFQFILEFNKKYDEFPKSDTVLNKYDEFEIVEVENVNAILEDLVEAKLRQETKNTLMKSAELLNNGDSMESVEFARKNLTDLIKSIAPHDEGYGYVAKAEERLLKYENIHQKTQNGIVGLTTGIPKLDQIVNGLESGDVTDYFLVFAPTNMGKTLFASYMMQSGWLATNDDDFPAYFSLEQNAEEIALNLDNMIGKIERMAMTRGTLSDDMRDRYFDYLKRLKSKRKEFMIYDLSHNKGKPFSIEDIRRILEYKKHTRFCIDQLSKIRSSTYGNDLRQRLFDVSAKVRELILELKIPAYVLAQANRNASSRVKDRMKRDKDSSDIAIEAEDIGEAFSIVQDASKGISIVKLKDDVFKLKVIKNRNSKSGQELLFTFNFETGFLNVINQDVGEQHF